jgi:hypothetical protein
LVNLPLVSRVVREQPLTRLILLALALLGALGAAGAIERSSARASPGAIVYNGWLGGLLLHDRGAA